MIGTELRNLAPELSALGRVVVLLGLEARRAVIRLSISITCGCDGQKRRRALIFVSKDPLQTFVQVLRMLDECWTPSVLPVVGSENLSWND